MFCCVVHAADEPVTLAPPTEATAAPTESSPSIASSALAPTGSIDVPAMEAFLDGFFATAMDSLHGESGIDPDARRASAVRERSFGRHPIGIALILRLRIAFDA